MLVWLLAALAAGGTAADPGFSCWKRCRSRWFLCSWPPRGPAGDTSYLLTLCYVTPRLCQRFEAGARTTYTLKHHHVYVLTNATAWVEARRGDHVHRTPNLTLYLDEAVKPDPPPSGTPFTKSGGRLRLRVPRPPCHRGGWPPQREARFRRTGHRDWTQVTCEAVTEEDDSVSCALGRDGAFEVQLRHKPSHWSSYWSDWSGSIFVPEEILASPAPSYQLGKLGRDGQRGLRLDWQPAPREQGDVTYTLRVRVLACRCARPAQEDVAVLGGEVTAHNLTLCGAEYQILLTAANAAGPGPAWQLRVPAEQRPDLGFKDVRVAGGAVTARWEAPSPGFVYCFERQPLPGAPNPGVCVQRDFPAGSVHVERGALEAPGCYRLAVHGWAPARGWATFALRHHYAGNASLALPVQINTSAGDAAAVVLRWSPSPRAACPGVLAKYLVCHAARGDNVTYGEADAAASHYTLRNLRPGAAYRVGVWEVTAESEGTCSAGWHFQTKALGPQGAAWRSNLKYLGISLGLPAAAAVYRLSKKRARRLLFPPLPKPVGSKAVQFSDGETGPGQPRPGLLEPLERFSAAELLLTEPDAGKETPDAGKETPDTGKETLDAGKETPDAGTRPGMAAEEPAAARSPGRDKGLPFAYRRQEVPSRVGFPPPGSDGHPLGEEEEEEEEEEERRQELRQPLVPIALLISDKPVIIRDQGAWDPPPETLVP